MAISARDGTVNNTTDVVNATLTDGRGEGPDRVIKHGQSVIRRNWGYSKVPTRGKAYA